MFVYHVHAGPSRDHKSLRSSRLDLQVIVWTLVAEHESCAMSDDSTFSH